MRILRGLDDISECRGGRLSIGNFDGVHLGHQAMLATLVSEASAAGVPSIAMTFEPHPLNLVAPERAPVRLTSSARRAELIAGCGVDWLIEYPTDNALLSLSAEEFFERIIRSGLGATGIVEGPNFCFGRGRGGTIDVLRSLCEQAQIPLTVLEAISANETLVSSSAIRQAIAAGKIADAVAMLGNPYRLTGTVVRGAGRGTSLGFGTANLEGIPTLLPQEGVYGGVSRVGGRLYPAAVNCGGNPTFEEHARKTEVHLVGYTDGELYGQDLSVDLIGRVRETRKFAGVDELKTQLASDIRDVVAMSQAVINGSESG